MIVEITAETHKSAAVLHFIGSADIAAVDQIRKTIGETMDKACCRIVCDLSQTDFICSDALGVFITAHEGARAADGFVRLVHPQARIADILATTQLNRLFQVYDTIDQALKA